VSVSAIIPVKNLDEAKSRLSSLLSAKERREFCLEMLRDVLTAVKTTRCIKWTVVVSMDATVFQTAKSFDVVPLKESEPGLNQAVSEGVSWCVRNGAKSVLILPADIPLVTPGDLDRIFSLGKVASMVISPSRSKDGTNALLLTPPNVLPTFYGKHSFRRYLEEATKRAISLRIIKLPRIALDIDTIEDLTDFVNLNTKETSTHKFLVDVGIYQRLSKR